MTQKEYEIFEWLDDKERFHSVGFNCQIGTTIYYNVYTFVKEDPQMYVVSNIYNVHELRPLTEEEAEAIQRQKEARHRALDNYKESNGYDAECYRVWRKDYKSVWFLSSHDGRYEFVTVYHTDSVSVSPIESADDREMTDYYGKSYEDVLYFLKSYPSIPNVKLVSVCPTIYMPYPRQYTSNGYYRNEVVLQQEQNNRFYWVNLYRGDGRSRITTQCHSFNLLRTDLERRIKEFHDKCYGGDIEINEKERQEYLTYLYENGINSFKTEGDILKLFFFMAINQKTIMKHEKYIVAKKFDNVILRHRFISHVKMCNSMIEKKKEEDKRNKAISKLVNKGELEIMKDEMSELKHQIKDKNREIHEEHIRIRGRIEAEHNKDLYSVISVIKPLLMMNNPSVLAQFDYTTEEGINRFLLCLRQCGIDTVTKEMKNVIYSINKSHKLSMFSSMSNRYNLKKQKWSFPTPYIFESEPVIKETHRMTLNLPIKTELYDALLEGGLYQRDVTPNLITRLYNDDGTFKPYEALTIRRGNTSTSKTFIVVDISVVNTSGFDKFCFKLGGRIK